MERIVIAGEGYPASKAVGVVRRTFPKADIVWISDQDKPKYPVEVSGLLLRSGSSPDQWPRVRARIKVEFETCSRQANMLPRNVKRISFNSAEHEISFMSNMGFISYQFDKAFVFCPMKVATPQYAEKHHVWPGSSCTEYLAENWKNINHPVIVSNEMDLLQVLVRGGNETVWVRSEAVFNPQLQFFLDELLKDSGVNIVHVQDLEKWKDELGKRGIGYNQDQVFVSGSYVPDMDRLNSYGLDFLNSDNFGEKPSDSVVIVNVFENIRSCLSRGLESQTSFALAKIQSAIENKSTVFSTPSLEFWNFGKFSASLTKDNVTISSTAQQDLLPAIIHGRQGINLDEKYALQLTVNTGDNCLAEAQAVGPAACEWANMVSLLVRSRSRLTDLMNIELAWLDTGINPFKRCLSYLRNKTLPGILGITPDELRQSSENGAEFFLMDVRSKQEFEKGRVPGATNIPLSELKKRVMEIPRFTPLVLYSQCSGRAYESARMLKSMGAKQLYVLDGGFGLYHLEKDFSVLSHDHEKQAGGCSVC